MKIYYLGEEVLRKKAKPIENINEETLKLIDKMFIAMEENNGIGLAAPQIGKNIRLFIILLDDGVKRVFINPQIIETSIETCLFEEGCLSLPDIFEDVERPTRVTVQALNEKGKPFTLKAEDLLARAIQHEYDHLEGVLFIDKIDSSLKQAIEKSFAKRKTSNL